MNVVICVRSPLYAKELSAHVLKAMKVESMAFANSLEETFDMGDFLRADIVLIDADFVPTLETIKEKLVEMKNFSSFVILTDGPSAYLEEEVIKHREFYTLRKPISEERLRGQMGLVIKESQCSILVKKKREERSPLLASRQKTFRLLLECGFNIKHTGFLYLNEAVLIKISSPKGSSLTGCIYPFIARKFNVSSESVERAIRHAINYALKEEKRKQLREKGIDIVRIIKPTNLSIINYLANKVVDEMEDFETCWL